MAEQTIGACQVALKDLHLVVLEALVQAVEVEL
jgi:hypothetical protein